MGNPETDKAEKRPKSVVAAAGWAVFQTILFVCWVVYALAEHRIDRQLFASLSALAFGLMAILAWTEAVALWKSRRDGRKR